MRLLTSLLFIILFSLDGLSSDVNPDPTLNDQTKLESAVFHPIDKWMEDYEKLPDQIKTSDQSAIAQRSYFSKLKSNFNVTLKEPIDSISQDPITRAIHSSLQYHAGISKKLVFSPTIQGINPGPEVLFWHLEVNEPTLRSSAVEQLCIWLAQNGDDQGWAAANSPIAGKTFYTKQILGMLRSEAYAKYFTKISLASFIEYLSVSRVVPDPAQLIDVNHVLSAIAANSPDVLQDFLSEAHKLSPDTTANLLEHISLDALIRLNLIKQ